MSEDTRELIVAIVFAVLGVVFFVLTYLENRREARNIARAEAGDRRELARAPDQRVWLLRLYLLLGVLCFAIAVSAFLGVFI